MSADEEADYLTRFSAHYAESEGVSPDEVFLSQRDEETAGGNVALPAGTRVSWRMHDLAMMKVALWCVRLGEPLRAVPPVTLPPSPFDPSTRLANCSSKL